VQRVIPALFYGAHNEDDKSRQAAADKISGMLGGEMWPSPVLGSSDIKADTGAELMIGNKRICSEALSFCHPSK
jgi:hypothetical protein